MNILDIISKKKAGEELSKEEIEFFVSGYTESVIPDYQASALLMAIVLKGMTEKETVFLTEAMLKTGNIKDLSSLGENTADKHSTGGVGDKTTLIAMPIAAAMGMKIAKMSGRALGHTGGTIDKLEAIKGYKINLSEEEFIKTVEKTSLSVIYTDETSVPADKKIYALRDVTGTTDSLPLIASSIMSKKLSSGAKNILLDVKMGSGSFMKTKEDAEKLGRLMVKIGGENGRRVGALITDMDEPLGLSVGNALEILEALEVLGGGGEERLRTLCLKIAAAMAELSFSVSEEEALKAAEEALISGAAKEKFREWITAQGGNASFMENESLLKPYPPRAKLFAKESGYFTVLNTEKIGMAALLSGAGRLKKEDKIDYFAGILLKKKKGDKVEKGEVLAEIYSESDEKAEEAKKTLEKTLAVVKEEPQKTDIVIKTIM